VIAVKINSETYKPNSDALLKGDTLLKGVK
jgi:hypothetical protein